MNMRKMPRVAARRVLKRSLRHVVLVTDTRTLIDQSRVLVPAVSSWGLFKGLFAVWYGAL